MLGPHHLLKEPFCRANIASRAEHELNCASFFVYSAIQIFTGLHHLNISLIHPIGSAAHLQVLAHTFIDLGRITLYPRKTVE